MRPAPLRHSRSPGARSPTRRTRPRARPRRRPRPASPWGAPYRARSPQAARRVRTARLLHLIVEEDCRHHLGLLGRGAALRQVLALRVEVELESTYARERPRHRALCRIAVLDVEAELGRGVEWGDELVALARGDDRPPEGRPPREGRGGLELVDDALEQEHGGPYRHDGRE